MKNLIVGFLLSIFALTISAQEGRNVAEYNLNSVGTGFINGNNSNAQGFDPVSVFPEVEETALEERTALEGRIEFALNYEGVEYLFANETNMKTFLTKSSKV